MLRYSQYYQINYSDSKVLAEIKKLGRITFESKVLNMVLLESKYKASKFNEVDGVLKVIPTSKSWHKK